MVPTQDNHEKTMKAPSWLTPTMAMTIPAAMLTEPSLTMARTSEPARVKLNDRKLWARIAPWVSYRVQSAMPW